MRRIVITDEWIKVEEFEPWPNGSCRDVGDLAVAWALTRLSEELGKSLEWRRAYANNEAAEPTDKICV